MTVRFANWRLSFFVTILVLSAVALGISAYFASIFLPDLHHDFTIFSIIVPVLTILVFLIIEVLKAFFPYRLYVSRLSSSNRWLITDFHRFSTSARVKGLPSFWMTRSHLSFHTSLPSPGFGRPFSVLKTAQAAPTITPMLGSCHCSPDVVHGFDFSAFATEVSAFQLNVAAAHSPPDGCRRVLYPKGLLEVVENLQNVAFAEAAWATSDAIGNTQCDGLGGQTIETRKGSVSAKGYCCQMKVLQAFSWMNFCLFAIGFYILLRLVSQAEQFGRPDAWIAPIRELGWFGEYPGLYPTSGATHNPAAQGMPPMGGGYQSQQSAYQQRQQPYASDGWPYGQMMEPAPGTALVIQPGINGAPPTFTQVPANAV
ncbi:uncharacterized protein SCHCODRAFT_01182103 [Schizophyllum commune H4-8]|uniref:Uncharacterized protein n=1 Tax=Schizophyllum commune (strain H4-8 / FGSC 9210) TaxID=578458 RepID=D8Q8I7_SCHCM|nr:uncharacterized protein SCHCODRAFT_01182103 [Schizophyllum commune H4-8]KAI5890797.1 hypothetical protein SCHCODRAFT_01182103 [Schizophyllum commune H4-8]